MTKILNKNGETVEDEMHTNNEELPTVDKYPPRYPSMFIKTFRDEKGDLLTEINTTLRRKIKGKWFLFPGMFKSGIKREHVSEIIIAESIANNLAMYLDTFERTYLASLNEPLVIEDPDQRDVIEPTPEEKQ